MAFAYLRGVRIHYELSGEDELPVLVLSNSLGVNLTMWEQQLQSLGSQRRILRYDTRGHGQSSVPVGPYSIDELGQDVLDLLDRLQIGRASFCGLSMGGVIGQWLGIHAPDRLHRLVLANTAAKIGIEATWDSRIAQVQKDGLTPIVSGTLERWFTAPFRAAQPEIVAKTAAMLQATSAEGYAACCAAIRDADFRAEMASIRVPTLVIAGIEDPVTPPSDSRFLAESIAESSYVELAAAHLSNVEAASEFNAALRHFLSA